MLPLKYVVLASTRCVLGSPENRRGCAYLGSTFGFSISLLTGELVTMIEVFSSGNGVSNLASVAESHAKKLRVAVPGPPLAKAIPPEPFAAPGT